jgi:tripartite-type tricarboxylate transporter receptor subunit TctC
MSWAKQISGLLVLSAALMVAVVACGGDDPTPTPKPAAAAPAASAPTATPVPAKPTATPKPAAKEEAPAPTATPVPAFDAESYFKGKTVKIIVGFSPGGGYDTYARLIAATISDYIPGKPRVIVQNLPGGGGLRGLQTAMAAKPDGLTAVTMANRWPAREAAGEDVKGFDPYTAEYIGTPSYTNKWTALCVRSDVATNWEEVVALGRDITTGTSAPGGDMIGGEFVSSIGLPVKVIYGYEGTSEVLAAVDRKELDATTRCPGEFWLSLYPEWEEKKMLKPLFYWKDPIPEAELTRMGVTGSVPHVFDVTKANAEQQAAFNLAEKLESMTRMYTLPPKTPKDIVETWRSAFKSTLTDAKFVERASQLEREINYGDPEDFVAAVQAGKGLSTEGRELFKALYGLK